MSDVVSPSGLQEAKFTVPAGSAEFLPPIWDIVVSLADWLANTRIGNTAVYFFLTKESAIRYILRPNFPPVVRFFLYREKVDLLRRMGYLRFSGII